MAEYIASLQVCFVGDLTGEVLRKRLRAFDDQLEHLGIGAPRNLASGKLSVRPWTPDTGDAGRQAPRARCSPVQHAIISDS